MESLRFAEAKTPLPRLVELVKNGESITITRHGQDLAPLIHLRSSANTPMAWGSEVAYVLLVAQGLSRLAGARSFHFLDLLSQLPIEIDPSPMNLTALTQACQRHNLSAFDAADLPLAKRLGIAPATLDLQLSSAHRNAGVNLVRNAYGKGDHDLVVRRPNGSEIELFHR